MGVGFCYHPCILTLMTPTTFPASLLVEGDSFKLTGQRGTFTVRKVTHHAHGVTVYVGCIDPRTGASFAAGTFYFTADENVGILS